MGNSAMSMESSDPKQDYECPICQEVLKMPIRTRQCQHVFCKTCFQTAVRSQGPQCPMCRGSVSEREPKAMDIQQYMRETKAKCRACGSEKFLNRMRLHYKTCKRYIEEYGPIDNPTSAPSVLAQVPPQVPVQVPMETYSSEVIPNVQILTLPDSVSSWIMRPDFFPTAQGQRVYNCPYCPVNGLRDLDLVKHCLQHHAHDPTPAVCPICERMPFGNSDYHSQNLIFHFLLRHRFSYSGYMNEDDDEDVQIYMAVQSSLEQF